MKAGRSGKLARMPLTGTWFRTIRLQHWKTRLSSDHSRVTVSRFNASTPSEPRYRILYLAETPQVALHEVRALVGDPNAPIADTRSSWVLLSLQVVLDHVVNLTDPGEQKIISTNHAELTGNWVNDPGLAPTQSLGQQLYDLADVEGFLYPSSLVNGSCLAVFPDKSGPRSSLVFRNEISGRVEALS
jgi:RES domain-containing protein